ncbi:MAG: hypothetical protein ACKVKM_07955, partial [Verrucomicrobiia bacterium]
MNQLGFVFRVALSIGFIAISVNVRAQAAPPPGMPSQDAIQRLMEEERRLRAQAVNDPITQEAIANAKLVAAALGNIDRKSQLDLTSVRQLAQQATQAARYADAISRYRQAIKIEYEFKAFVNTQLKGLVRADHAISIKALSTMDLSMSDIRAGYLKVTEVMVEAAWQKDDFLEAKGYIEDTLGWLPDNAELQMLLRESEKRSAAYVRSEPSPDAASRRE